MRIQVDADTEAPKRHQLARWQSRRQVTCQDVAFVPNPMLEMVNAPRDTRMGATVDSEATSRSSRLLRKDIVEYIVALADGRFEDEGKVRAGWTMTSAAKRVPDLVSLKRSEQLLITWLIWPVASRGFDVGDKLGQLDHRTFAKHAGNHLFKVTASLDSVLLYGPLCSFMSDTTVPPNIEPVSDYGAGGLDVCSCLAGKEVKQIQA
ncbi:hypothetical protein B0I35DRAFT_415012 [Stachybotrys elegans]|uniref:Uncharacterized protein n=1 Tax=Stachybotrys elegans TaxID=80388 RepID=A0A8K0WKS1_9HYPO|nr:hypothetical protein B0I35DRAFT_415012 [Stachybotrys elegans]